MIRAGAGLALAALLSVAGAPRAAAAPVTVRFEVRVPASTPAGAEIWISGSLDALGAWSGRGVRLARTGEGRYAGQVTLERGAAFEFKVTRGDWGTVEKGASGEEVANRFRQVTGADTVRVRVASWRDQVEASSAPSRHTLTGDIREHPDFHSAFVGARTVRVWLPPGYDADTTLRCPVLYFQDGQNVFDAATSFMGSEWKADEAATWLVENRKVPPFIVVAVDNTPARIDEYTPVADARHGGGGAVRYAQFLIRELKPFIDRTYRTRPEPGATGVVGSSLGGLLSLWLGLEYPGTFGLIGAVSPTASWADGYLIRQVAAGRGAGLRIWLDIGTRESPDPAAARRAVEDVRQLRAALDARGYRSGANLHYQEFEGAPHNEIAWSGRVRRIMAFLLSGPGTPAGAPGRN